MKKRSFLFDFIQKPLKRGAHAAYYGDFPGTIVQEIEEIALN